MPENEVAPPIVTPEGLAFTLEEVSYAPLSPRKNEPFIVRGKIDLFRLPFFGPIWIIATVLYPEKWWEEIIPIWGSPEIRKDTTALGGDFEISFPQGFDREGEFGLTVRAYAGPTMPVDTITLPPFPPVSTVEGTFTVEGEVPEEEIAFSLTRPTVSPTASPEPGAEIIISCPVLSEATKEQNIKVKCIIYEGSILPGHGTKLAEYMSEEIAIAPGESKTFEFTRTTVAGTIDRRDVEVEVYIGEKVVKQSEWDDVYYVGKPPEEKIDFALTRPSVTPSEITPGTPITITCPVTSACTKEQTVTAKVIIYEGSILPGHGTKLKEYTSPSFSIAPGASYNVVVSHTAVAGTIDRRDVEVEVYIAGKLVKQSEWDDVYYVKVVELELLEVKIDPSGAGTVTVDPAPSEGIQHNWYFPHGTTVYVTAHPKSGYTFKSWSGEMTDTPAITAPVYPMTEKRTITAHFALVEPPEEKIDFALTRPSVTPSEISPGTAITITCPVTSACTKGQTVTAKVKIYEGSFLPGHGTLLDTKTSPAFTISPGQTYNVKVSRTAVAGTIDRRDVEVEIYIAGKLVKESEWDDVYYVKEKEVVEHRLTLHASPSAGGTVSGAGTYPHMERVKITAHPKSGWYFDHWGGDFVSSDNPAYVYMSSDRDVTAYFYEEAVEEFTVTVRADPSYGGTVSKSPDKPKYEYGELIRLSCTPASGYYLYYWTRDGEWIESRESFTTGVIRNHIFIALFRKR